MSDNPRGDLEMRNDQGHLQEEEGFSEPVSSGKSQVIHGPEGLRQMWKNASTDGRVKNGHQLLTFGHGTTVPGVSIHSPHSACSNSNQPINLRTEKRTPPDPDSYNPDSSKHAKYVQPKEDHLHLDGMMKQDGSVSAVTHTDPGHRPWQAPNRGMSQTGHVPHAAIHKFVQEKLNTMSLDTINSYLRRHRVHHDSEEPSGHASASQTPTGRGHRLNQNQQGTHSQHRTCKLEKGLIYDPRVDSDIEGESWTRNVLSPITGKMNILSYSWNVIKSEDGTDEYVMESATRVRPKAGPESNNIHFPRSSDNYAINQDEVDRTQTEEKVNIANFAPSTSYMGQGDVDNDQVRSGTAALAQSFKQHLDRATDQNHLYKTIFVDLTLDEEENQRQPRQETARVDNAQRGVCSGQGPISRPILTIRQGPLTAGYQTQMDYPPPPPSYWQPAPPQLVPPPAFGPPHLFNFSLAPPGPPSMFPPHLPPPPLGGMPSFYPAHHIPAFPPDSSHMQGFGSP